MFNLTSGVLLISGMFIGATMLLFIFLLVIGTVVKIPNHKATHLWVIGGSIPIVTTHMTVIFREYAGFLFNLILFCGMIFAFVLFIWGIDQFENKKPNYRSGFLFVAGLSFPYAVLLLNGTTFLMRMTCFAIVPLVLWPTLMRKIYRTWPDRYELPKAMMGLGVILLCANGFVRLYALWSLKIDTYAFGNADFGRLMAVFIFTMVGSVLFSIGVILLFFARVLEHTRHTAMHDELTGLLNRQAIVSSGEHETALACSRGQSVMLALLDVDLLKQINHLYGHGKGDMVLREIALILRKLSGRTDLLGRYGGEEFCLIFPNENYAGAGVIGERLLTALREHHFEGVPNVTISVGLALMDAHSLPISFADLLARAETELQRAKLGGRNRYCMREEVMQTPETPGANAGLALAIPN